MDWHIPETRSLKISWSCLRLAAHAITLFARRRMGKTVLLIEDVWPIAKKKGYDVQCASFWADKSDPQGVFLEAIGDSPSRLNDTKALFGIFGSYIEVTPQNRPQDKENKTAAITKQFKSLVKKKVLLLLDEIQQLAIGESSDRFV